MTDETLQQEEATASRPDREVPAEEAETTPIRWCLEHKSSAYDGEGPMTTRYYEERECEHGEVGPHWLTATTVTAGMGYTKPVAQCPGGQRRELTGVEVRNSRNLYQRGEFYAQVIELGHGKPPGRYAIIPLD